MTHTASEQRPIRRDPRFLAFHHPLRTGEPVASWSARFMLSLVWFTWAFHLFAGGLGLTFIVRRHSEDPRILSLMTTIATLIMLGPLVSYVSDRIWTRLGRRRPFMIIAWFSAGTGMAALTFVGELREAISRIGEPLGIPALGELALIASIVVAYTTLYDLQAPMEPLFLECVPPAQRGSFFAMRSVLFNCATLYFFQILWPVFDQNLDLFAWLGFPGALHITGERAIFIVASSLFILTGLYIAFGIEERRPTDIEPVRFRDLGLVRFLREFFRDVFLNRKLYPFYLVLIIPGIENQVWGNFAALMQETEFSYTKEIQARWGMPIQLLSMLLLTPFGGWFCDWRGRLGNPARWAAFAGGLACILLAALTFRSIAPEDPDALPTLPEALMLNGLVAAAVVAFWVLLIEYLKDWTGGRHLKAWVSLLTLVLGMCWVGAVLAVVQASGNGGPPATLWMALQQIPGALTGLAVGFTGPMVYEYIAPSRMGTMNSGRGVLTGIVGFAIPNLGAWWVIFYSSRFAGSAEGTYIYSSLFILQFLLFVPSIAVMAWFVRQVWTGRIPPEGLQSYESRPT